MQIKPFWFEPMSQEELERWRKPWVAISVIVICGGLFSLKFLMPSLPIYHPFTFAIPTAWFETYRLLTPIFLHFSVLHIAFNTAIFWFFGRQIETLFGHWALMLVVILSGVISNFGQYLISGDRFGGLSGVVLAVVAYVWMDSRFAYQSRVFIPQGLMIFIVASLLLGFFGFLDAIVGQIAHVAHLLGFLSGLVLWPTLNLFKQLASKK